LAKLLYYRLTDRITVGHPQAWKNGAEIFPVIANKERQHFSEKQHNSLFLILI
jgi:hypothetical protein